MASAAANRLLSNLTAALRTSVVAAVLLCGVAQAAAPVVVNKSALNFGSPKVDSTRSFSITNNQTVAVSIAFYKTGANVHEFGVISSTTCGSTLAAHKACGVVVEFAPCNKQPASATLVVTVTPDSGSPHQVLLLGNGASGE